MSVIVGGIAGVMYPRFADVRKQAYASEVSPISKPSESIRVRAWTCAAVVAELPNCVSVPVTTTLTTPGEPA